MSDAFQVGDKVLCDNSRIGVITKITQKKKNITVDYGRYTGTYNCNGVCNIDNWHWSMIEKLTPDVQKRFDDKNAILKCRRIFDEKKMAITAEQAKAIISILE